MVELSSILSEFIGFNEQFVKLARVINSHGKGNYILRRRLDYLVEGEDDPQSFIDGLQSYGVITTLESLESCSHCETPLFDESQCILCDIMPRKTGALEFYKVINEIIFKDEWRSLISDKIDQSVDFQDREFLKLISSQQKSLESLPIVPIELQKLEEQYQLIGARVLNSAYEVNLESLTKLGRSDVKFNKVGDITNHVGEYKLWSNKSGNPVDQCLNYFIPETNSGFVFMVNDSKGNVWDGYIENYVKSSSSFRELNPSEFILRSDINFINIYRSFHHCEKSNKTVPIFHFIYDLYGSFGLRERKAKVAKSPKTSKAKAAKSQKTASKSKTKSIKKK